MAHFNLPQHAPAGWATWALAVIFVAPLLPLLWGVVVAWRRRRRLKARFRPDRCRAAP